MGKKKKQTKNEKTGDFYITNENHKKYFQKIKKDTIYKGYFSNTFRELAILSAVFGIFKKTKPKKLTTNKQKNNSPVKIFSPDEIGADDDFIFQSLALFYAGYHKKDRVNLDDISHGYQLLDRSNLYRKIAGYYTDAGISKLFDLFKTSSGDINFRLIQLLDEDFPPYEYSPLSQDDFDEEDTEEDEDNFEDEEDEEFLKKFDDKDDEEELSDEDLFDEDLSDDELEEDADEFD